MANNINGIDVSLYQGVIDWEKVSPQIDFAVLRCGYGSDIITQDDAQYERNATECERLGIPYAIYLYSYATSESMIDSEVAHTLRLIGTHKPFCVYLDMEDNSTVVLGKTRLTAFAKRFCEAIKKKGFKVGIYANQNWFQNYLDVKSIYDASYSVWCAKYSDSTPDIAASYDIWQYSSTGRIDGISGNVDMNYMYNDIRKEMNKVKAVDNTPDTYAKEAVDWAIKNGILKGTVEGDFMLHSNLTRQDALVFLHRAIKTNDI